MNVIAKSLPITKVVKYETIEKTVSHTIEFDGIDIEGNKTIQLIQDQSGSISLSLKPQLKFYE